MKEYGVIGDFRLLDIKVINNNVDVIYEGMVENAPDEIKHMKYTKIEMDSPIRLYVYN